MEQIIQYFHEKSLNIFTDLMGELFKSPRDLAPFILGVKDEVNRIGILIVKETLEMMDQMLCSSGKRSLDWVIEQSMKKQLITSLGTVTFKKTLFENKQTGQMCFLLDRILGLEKNERITEDALAAIYEEAVQTSYRKGGEAASVLDSVSKQSVKNKLHALRFPQIWKAPPRKKVVDYLYIEADEDHIALQFRQKRGDLVRDENGHKNNDEIAKLVYVHEGVEPEAPKSSRYRLVNPYYFCSTVKYTSNEQMWDEVYRYLDAQYDLSSVKKIYVNSDGGAWIRSGMRQIRGLVHVLDGYHLGISIRKLANHMGDSADDAADEIRRVIRTGTKQSFRELTEVLASYFEKDPTRSFKDNRDYILSHWTASKYRLSRVEGKVGSSTEGHVYHVLASRMSTKAMGWSPRGADRMAQLRAYYLNGGDMLELARFQKQELPKAAGAEETKYLTGGDVINVKEDLHGILGKYHDAITHSISLQNKKKVYFQTQIWGL